MTRAATVHKLPTEPVSGSRWSTFAQGVRRAMTETSKGVSVNWVQFIVGLILQVAILAAAGYAMVARLDQRMTGIEEKVAPLSETLIELGRLQEKVDQQKEKLRLNERDIRLNERDIKDIEIELGIRRQLQGEH